jgi:hypothetical protein
MMILNHEAPNIQFILSNIRGPQDQSPAVPVVSGAHSPSLYSPCVLQLSPDPHHHKSCESLSGKLTSAAAASVRTRNTLYVEQDK